MLSLTFIIISRDKKIDIFWLTMVENDEWIKLDMRWKLYDCISSLPPSDIDEPLLSLLQLEKSWNCVYWHFKALAYHQVCTGCNCWFILGLLVGRTHMRWGERRQFIVADPFICHLKRTGVTWNLCGRPLTSKETRIRKSCSGDL